MQPHDAHKEIAARLCERQVDDIAPATGGGNNRIYKVTAGPSHYALKFYPPQEGDGRDRLGTEFVTLSFLSENGIYNVPAPIARDQSNHFALYSWIDGATINNTSSEDVTALADFLLTLQELRNKPGAKGLELASAACPAPGDAIDQLLDRLERLKQKAVPSPDLSEFLRQTFEPAVEQAVDDAKVCLTALSSTSSLALSPSDFGLHNALRREDGTLALLDFEYFGWDDPVKAVADVMLHPGVPMADKERALFFDRVAPFFIQEDTEFEPRFAALYPIYGLIWCLIILNDFLPERWERRRIAGEKQPWENIRMQQLAKAGHLLNSLQDGGRFHVGT